MTYIVLDIGDPLVDKNLGLCLMMFDSSNVEGAGILGTMKRDKAVDEVVGDVELVVEQVARL